MPHLLLNKFLISSEELQVHKCLAFNQVLQRDSQKTAQVLGRPSCFKDSWKILKIKKYSERFQRVLEMEKILKDSKKNPKEYKRFQNSQETASCKQLRLKNLNISPPNPLEDLKD